MSRSHRKNPYGNVCQSDNGAMKEWKKQSNRKLRRLAIDDNSPNGNHYRRINDIWSSPSDGKTYIGDWDKWKRK